MATTKSTKKIPAERKPFYALAGAGDLAAEKLRTLPTELQAELAKVPARLQQVPTQLQRVPAELAKVPAQVQALPARATTARTAATGLYSELASRGEKALSALRGTARTTTTRRRSAAS